MNKMGRNRFKRLLGATLAAAIFVSTLPFAGISAYAASGIGDFFLDGNPPFAYVVTGVKPAVGGNTVRLYQNENMQSYAGYTGSYEIPEQVYNAEEMGTAYTVTKIDDGALEGVAMRGISLPNTVTSIGARAFADCVNLTEMTFPTSVAKVGEDAFNNTNVQKLTLSVAQNAILTGNSAYTVGSTGAHIALPCNVSELKIFSVLTVTGDVYIPGATVISNSGVTVQPGAALSLNGGLSGSGVIEVKDNATLTVSGSVAAYRGSIRLTGEKSEFKNDSLFAVSVLNAKGTAVSVPAGDALLGEQDMAPSNVPEIPVSTDPVVNTNYGGTVTVEEDGKVVVITAYDGYIVEEVVINGLSMGSITRYEFETATNTNSVSVTFAEGKPVEGPEEPAVDPSVFLDIPEGATYAEAVSFLKNNGILQGVSKTNFAPNRKTSRAMFLSVMKRLEIYGDDFAVKCEEPVYPVDVVSDSWYGEAAAWAAGVGIINKKAELDANKLITREEAAVCLYRYTHARGYATVTDAGRYYAYRDSLMLSGESRQAMVWAATSGYLKTSKGILDPAGTITRAELAEMFARYLKIN